MRLRSVYTLVGGDTRQAHVAQMLAAAGFMVHTAGVPGLCGTDACLHDAVRAADTVVLPMPAFAGGAHIRAQETIPLDAVLPWDHIDVGVRKAHLLHEREMAYASALSPDCRHQCAACGAAKLLKGGRCDG